MTFAELAEFEKRVLKSNDVLKIIEIGQNALRFKYAKIGEDLCIVMYYEYTYLPF